MKSIGLGAETLLIGTVASDDSHADGRSEFVERIRRLLEYKKVP